MASLVLVSWAEHLSCGDGQQQARWCGHAPSRLRGPGRFGKGQQECGKQGTVGLEAKRRKRLSWARLASTHLFCSVRGPRRRKMASRARISSKGSADWSGN